MPYAAGKLCSNSCYSSFNFALCLLQIKPSCSKHHHITMRSSPPFPGWVKLASFFLCLTQTVMSMVLNNSTKLESILDQYKDKDEEWWRARSRGRRAISDGDMHLILDLHNKLRGQVHPPASNMEYMVRAEDTALCFTAIPFCIQEAKSDT